MSQIEQEKQSPEQDSSKESLRLTGRILWLTKDPKLIRRQVEGEDLGYVRPEDLLDRISTDQIIPSQWCMTYSDPENLAKHLLTGVEGIESGDLKGKFQAIGWGSSAGRGSSREHSQLAFQGAGIDFLIGGSFERIFKENCHNYRIYTLNHNQEQTAKLLSGESLTVEQLIAHEDPLTQEIVKAGGLIAFTKARLEGRVGIPKVDTHSMPMTIAEKIIARNTRIANTDNDGVSAVKPGDGLIARVDKKYAYELQTIISQQVLGNTFGEEAPVKSDNVWLFEDHLALMPADIPVTVRHRDAQRAFAQKYGIPEYRADSDGVEGICHTVMLERHVLPGELVLGNDSHTCHLGVANALAVGKGASEFASALITGDIPLKVPETIRVFLKGKLRVGITTTDVMLHLISLPQFKAGIASGKVLQFGGEALNEINVDEQATFTNMAIEGQAFTGIVEPNEKLVEFMMSRHNYDKETVKELLVYPDEEVAYFDNVEIDLDNVERMVSLPGDTQNAVPLSGVKDTKINYFYIGSCKQGNLESLRQAAALLKGRRIAQGVRMQIQANTREVENTLREEGILEIFERSGIEVIGRGCGPCMGATSDANDREEIVLSATDRNFQGRMGRNRLVYLASVPVVVASAVAGKICEPEDIN